MAVNGEETFIYSKWRFFLRIVAEKLNATLKYRYIPNKFSKDYYKHHWLINYGSLTGTLDFYLDFDVNHGALYSYNYVNVCYLIAEPKGYSVIELVLILPFDE